MIVSLALIIIIETNKCIFIIIIKEKELNILVYRRDLERAQRAKISSVDTFLMGDTSEKLTKLKIANKNVKQLNYFDHKF